VGKNVRVVVCGFGRVGRNFARLLEAKRADLASRYGLEIVLTGVGELGGSVLDEEGIPPAAIAEYFEINGNLGAYPGGGRPGWEGIDLLRETGQADALIETTPTDIETGEPALSHIRAALGRGMHVVSANKGPFIRSYRELRALADSKGVALKLSAAAAAALPTIDVAQTCLAGAEIQAIEGVLNGTSNFILSRMRTGGASYDEALAEAQRLGIAETDPTLDVEGYDTANQLALIASVAMNAALLPEQVERTGISGVTADEVKRLAGEGKIMRLVGRAERDGAGGVRATVAPEALPKDHPLAGVDGSEKGIIYTTDTMDRVTVAGGKSDPRGAAAALLKDLINIYRAP
jgi:homoserine dehydrogenase